MQKEAKLVEKELQVMPSRYYSLSPRVAGQEKDGEH
jgi:hypothetical protein